MMLSMGNFLSWYLLCEFSWAEICADGKEFNDIKRDEKKNSMQEYFMVSNRIQENVFLGTENSIK